MTAPAASKGWRPLVTPGILVGLFGHAIATFIGIGLTALLGQGPPRGADLTLSFEVRRSPLHDGVPVAFRRTHPNRTKWDH